MKKAYTVVALYPDGQSFVEAFRASNPMEATNLCVTDMAENIGDTIPDWGDYEIIAVFEGTHDDVQPNAG